MVLFFIFEFDFHFFYYQIYWPVFILLWSYCQDNLIPFCNKIVLFLKKKKKKKNNRMMEQENHGETSLLNHY